MASCGRGTLTWSGPGKPAQLLYVEFGQKLLLDKACLGPENKGGHGSNAIGGPELIGKTIPKTKRWNPNGMGKFFVLTEMQFRQPRVLKSGPNRKAEPSHKRHAGWHQCFGEQPGVFTYASDQLQLHMNPQLSQQFAVALEKPVNISSKYISSISM